MKISIGKKLGVLLNRLILVYLAFLIVGCTTTNKVFFTKKSPHQQYSNKIENAGLNSSALGKMWLAAAEKGIQNPQSISLPYREINYYPAEQPRSSSYLFNLLKGEKLTILLTANPNKEFLVFADFWFRKEVNNTPLLLMSADTSLNKMEYEVEENGSYILRIQPELLKSGSCIVDISTTPTLAFPVPSGNKANVISVWGDDRDGGIRRHEGIDISGKLRTPLVAIANGIITRVKEDKIGGKIVMMRPERKNFNIYYAHLDEQLVKEGQSVNVGDTIGLMGNTGNASKGSPHLHFGIYTNVGAVNPLPYVNPNNTKTAAIVAPLQALNKYISNTKATNVYNDASIKSAIIEKLSSNTPLLVTSAHDSWYKVVLPNNKEVYIPFKETKIITAAINTYKPLKETILLEEANEMSSGKKLIPLSSLLNVYGSYGNFNLVEVDGLRGWVKK